MYNYNDLINEINKAKDNKYASFSSGLSGEKINYLGVRIPKLRELVKKYKNNFDLSTLKPTYTYEILFLYFSLNILSFDDFNKSIDFILENEKYWIGWGLNDSVYQYIKKPKDFNLIYDRLLELLKHKNQYIRRLAYLICFKYEKNKENLVKIFKLFKKDDDYYVWMAESWLLCDLYIYYPEETFMFLKEAKLGKIIVNKAVSKIHDSYRVSFENKKKADLLKDNK